jgi:hypothetical protein
LGAFAGAQRPQPARAQRIRAGIGNRKFGRGTLVEMPNLVGGNAVPRTRLACDEQVVDCGQR